MHMQQSLRRLIDHHFQELDNLSGTSLRKGKQLRKRLVAEAESHSHQMEVPYSSKRSKKRSGRLKRQKTREINTAMLFLQKSLHIGISESAIKQTNFLVVPEIYAGLKTASYRTQDVRNLSSDPVLPPRWQKVSSLMTGAVAELNEYHRREDYHPVEVAGLAHLILAYIHPFMDGNGRTARLVQDAYLDLFEFPVPIIRKEEKTNYQTILKRAMRDWREGTNDGIGHFLDYIATKVYESLHHVLGKK